MTRFFFLSDSCGFLDAGNPLQWEDGSVIYWYSCFWALPEQSKSHRTHYHILLSHLRLPQPRGQSPCRNIPQEQGGTFTQSLCCGYHGDMYCFVVCILGMLYVVIWPWDWPAGNTTVASMHYHKNTSCYPQLGVCCGFMIPALSCHVMILTHVVYILYYLKLMIVSNLLSYHRSLCSQTSNQIQDA
jgi:hypothetical protein